MKKAALESATRLRDLVEAATATRVNAAFIERLRAELVTIRPAVRDGMLVSDFELVEGRIDDLAAARGDLNEELELLENAVYGLYMSASMNADDSGWPN